MFTAVFRPVFFALGGRYPARAGFRHVQKGGRASNQWVVEGFDPWRSFWAVPAYYRLYYSDSRYTQMALQGTLSNKFRFVFTGCHYKHFQSSETIFINFNFN